MCLKAWIVFSPFECLCRYWFHIDGIIFTFCKKWNSIRRSNYSYTLKIDMKKPIIILSLVLLLISVFLLVISIYHFWYTLDILSNWSYKHYRNFDGIYSPLSLGLIFSSFLFLVTYYWGSYSSSLRYKNYLLISLIVYTIICVLVGSILYWLSHMEVGFGFG